MNDPFAACAYGFYHYDLVEAAIAVRVNTAPAGPPLSRFVTEFAGTVAGGEGRAKALRNTSA